MDPIGLQTDEMHRIYVIGIGVFEDDLTPRVKKKIETFRFIAGGTRYLKRLAPASAQWIPLTKDLKDAMAHIKEALQIDNVGVLASGDPLFFGIGQRLLQEFEKEYLVFYPNITTVQAAFSRLKMPWQNAITVSLHGREFSQLMHALLWPEDRPIAVFTDPVNSPAEIGSWLVENGLENLTVYVLEELGGSNEHVWQLSAKELVGHAFLPLNLLVIPSKPILPPIHLGMPEASYLHKAGLITKSEVRAVAVSKLMPLYDQVFWDIGAGSGSVGIEASTFLPKGRVFCVEKDIERLGMLRENCRKYNRLNVAPVQGSAPECLLNLPSPQRIFVGGGGERLKAILETCWQRLEPLGKLVISVILFQNLCVVHDFLKDKTFEAIQLQVTRSNPLGPSWYARAENPVWIFTVEKEG
jgi:precorrin-6Y C5,15-methyltransferase (decarboxylating)